MDLGKSSMDMDTVLCMISFWNAFQTQWKVGKSGRFFHRMLMGTVRAGSQHFRKIGAKTIQLSAVLSGSILYGNFKCEYMQHKLDFLNKLWISECYEPWEWKVFKSMETHWNHVTIRIISTNEIFLSFTSHSTVAVSIFRPSLVSILLRKKSTGGGNHVIQP